MRLTNKTPYRVIQAPDKKSSYKVWQVEFNDPKGPHIGYLEDIEFKSLEWGDTLRKAGVSGQCLQELQDFIKDYGQERYYEGQSDREEL